MAKLAGLVLVATPIGNLGDISPRAAETLAAVDVIYCEDTRRSRQLLSHLEISGKQLVSLHEHNEEARTGEVIAGLASGRTAALISDAGSPVVSDPGQRLVAAVTAAGFSVSAIPGPNAAIMALAISGLPAERFVFEGFLPTRGPARRERLAALQHEARTIILYESPHRLAKTVADLTTISGIDRRLVITRELTKLHEEVWHGRLTDALAHLENTPPRGEYTLVLEGALAEKRSVSDADIRSAIQREIALGQSRRSAVDAVSQRLGVPRRRVYTLALGIIASE